QNCYGCGICRSVCKKNAIKLAECNEMEAIHDN
ncbi:MAG: 4Fe-4S binding protein, partial [Elusimicrobia bacterium]|nr:4Fe-4S binding protein [Elusimicrobiota bacterium]